MSAGGLEFLDVGKGLDGILQGFQNNFMASTSA